MSRKQSPVYLSDQSMKFLGGHGDSLSATVNQTIDRYEKLLKHIELPHFTTAEINTLIDAIQGVLYQPAEMIAGFWEGVQDGLYDDLTGKLDEADIALIEKLKMLTYPQEVALLEFLEKRRK